MRVPPVYPGGAYTVSSVYISSVHEYSVHVAESDRIPEFKAVHRFEIQAF